jgi:hypothetical protein
MAVEMIGGPRLCEPLLALGKEHLPIGEAVGFQAHRNALRQTRSELLLSPVPRCRLGILALIN